MNEHKYFKAIFQNLLRSLPENVQQVGQNLKLGVRECDGQLSTDFSTIQVTYDQQTSKKHIYHLVSYKNPRLNTHQNKLFSSYWHLPPEQRPDCSRG